MTMPSRDQEQRKLRDAIEGWKVELSHRLRKVKDLASHCVLEEHQKEALKWMLWREKQIPRGGILADDMGLGKTLSMIALIVKSRQLKQSSSRRTKAQTSAATTEESETSDDSEEEDPSSPKGGTLIVCPLSLINHWENEIMNHVKKQKLSVFIHQGPNRAIDANKLSRLYHVVITTYDVVREEWGKGPLFNMSWERLILDEAHEVRNPKTKGCKAVCLLKADSRWCVTGTPVHNSLLDLYALFKVLKWAPFDEEVVWDEWIGLTELLNSSLWKDLRLAGILRRTKQELKNLKLPKKVECYIEINLDGAEDDLYQNVLEYSQKVISKSTPLPGPRGGPLTKSHLTYMHLLLIQRQICNHASLLKEDAINVDLDLDPTVNVRELADNDNLNATTDDDNADDRKIIDLKESWNGTKRDLSRHCKFEDPVFERNRESSKIAKLLELLEKIVVNTADKAVIVSQWTKMLDIVSNFLYSREHYISHKTISGSVASKERSVIVNQFNDSSSGLKVLLLSLKAGGVGLNLVGGNHLILLDLHWNPQLEAQACDRIYRMGQRKTVYIHKFITKNTIEEKIQERQKNKLVLADSVLDDPSQERLRGMTSLGDENYVRGLLARRAGNSRANKRKSMD